MTAKKAKELSLEVWRYLAELPICDKQYVLSELYNECCKHDS
jgi:hypothetical protein